MAIARWLFVVFAISLVNSAPAGDNKEELRKAVFAFERNLEKWPKGQDKERAQAIRDYFADLKTSAHKIAAIGMMDDRYVYQIPRSMVSELLAPLIKDPDIEVRVRAAHALGYNDKGGEHFEAVVALATQADASQLGSVIYAMARSRDERFLPHLRALLKHADGKVRAGAVFGLRNFPSEKVLSDVMALWDDPHEQVRYNLNAHCNLKTKEGLELLKKRLKDSSSHVRTGALDYLKRRQELEVPKIVAAMLTDDHPHVRGKALEALGELKADEYRDEFVKRFQNANEDLYVRRMAIRSFATLALPKDMPMVRELLRDEDNQVRQYAAEVIAAVEKRSRNGGQAP